MKIEDHELNMVLATHPNGALLATNAAPRKFDTEQYVEIIEGLHAIGRTDRPIVNLDEHSGAQECGM